MSSKRFKKLPEKSFSLAAEEINKLIPIIKKNCTTKFDESVDLSFQINIKQKKSEINIRTVVNLPGGTGKKVKVAVVCEESKTSEAKSAGADVVGGDEFIDKMTSTSEATIIEIPFEKFVFEPLPYINKIAKALNTVPDKVTIKEMKKQNVPRKHLTSAPKTKTYIRQGWELDEKYNNIFDEFSATREIYKQKISKKYLEMLDKNLSNYIDRYLSDV